MSELDPRWVLKGGIRVWIGDEFPDPIETPKVERPETLADVDELVCGTKRGTPAGAQKHYRAKSKTCEPCRIAANADAEKRRQNKTNTCVDCGKPITSRATRCNKCGSGKFRSYQKDADGNWLHGSSKPISNSRIKRAA